jgi:hypothetical protein
LFIPRLERRLHAMTAQLPVPFRQATLPRVATPSELLAEWAD